MIIPRITLVAWADRDPAFIFVSVPNERGRYLRTDPSVIRVPCPMCQAQVGEPCKRHYGSSTVYHSTTHADRRTKARRMGGHTEPADVVGHRDEEGV